MKKVLLLLLTVFFIQCEKPNDCIKSTGLLTSKVYEDLTFSKILVNKGIAVVIQEGAVCKVEVRTGENLVNDIEVKVADQLLTLTDPTTCNWTREYGATTVYITAPNLTDVYSKTEQSISSQGILAFSNLRLVSMNTVDGYSGIGTGDFIMQIQNQTLTIDNNDVSRFFLSGTTNQLNVNFYESGGIFQGENLPSNTIKVYHRGTNDMVVHPVDRIFGDIYSLGNVICVVRPPTVKVVQHYKGKLIFY